MVVQVILTTAEKQMADQAKKKKPAKKKAAKAKPAKAKSVAKKASFGKPKRSKLGQETVPDMPPDGPNDLMHGVYNLTQLGLRSRPFPIRRR